MDHDNARGIVEILCNAGIDASKMNNAEMLEQAKLLGWTPMKSSSEVSTDFRFLWYPKLPESPYWMVYLLVFFMMMALGATIWYVSFQTLINGAR